MNRFIRAILISVLLDTVLLWTFARFMHPVRPAGRVLTLNLTSDTIQRTNPFRKAISDPHLPQETEWKTETTESRRSDSEPSLKSPAETPIHPYENQLLEQEVKKRTFLATEHAVSDRDSLIQARIQAFLNEDPGTDVVGRSADEISDLLTNRAEGSNPAMVSTEQLFPVREGRQTERHPPRFDFIPTRVQILSMAFLYANQKADQIEIYSDIPIDENISAEGLNRSLDELVKKGLLSRKKISPEQLFNLFGIPLEMKSQNRKNEIYEYAPLVEQEKLMAFLQSRLFLLKERRRVPEADQTSLDRRIQDIEEKIRMLSRD